MKHLLLTVWLGLLSPSFLYAQAGALPDSCQPTTFLKIYGDTLKQDGISAICLAPNGNLYVAGQKANGYAIGEMTPSGDLLWLRWLTSLAGNLVFVTEIIVDNEGMIVGTGNKRSGSGNETVAFRFNPVTRQILWEHRTGIINPVEGGIMEKNPGGNYLIYHSPGTSAQSFKTVEILELDRATGQIVPTFAKQYPHNAQQVFAGMVRYGDALYATGYTDSLLSNNSTVRRMILTKLDANTGEVQWSRLGLTPWSEVSYFRGTDLIVDDSSLVVISQGSETHNSPFGSGQLVPVYLSRITLDGQMLWTKKYLLADLPKEVVATPDGYVIFCGYPKRHFLKTDKAGNLLFAKVLNPPDYFSAEGLEAQKNQVIRVDSFLYFNDFTARNNAIGVYTTLLKTDLNLDMAFNCGLDFFVAQGADMANPVLFPVAQTVQQSSTTTYTFSSANAAGAIKVHKACPVCSEPPCFDKPDITFQLESVGCGPTAFANYRLCNLGKQPYSGALNIGVYGSNPVTGAATLLDLLSLQVNNLLPDSCRTGVFNNLSFWGNNVKIFTLAGIVNGQTTPVNLSGFPYNNTAECDYANNLDSLVVQYPPAPPKPALGPDRILCAGQTATLNAGTGFVSYQWSNNATTPVITASASGTYTVAATDACGRTQRDTVVVTVLPAPTPTTLTIQFYPGDTVVVAGVAYTQPATVVQTLLTPAGCDSVVTTILELVTTTVSISCPASQTVTIPAGQSSAAISYAVPAATTDCPDADITLIRTQGLPSGAAFPVGSTQVCYMATNQCGAQNTCCFTVTVQQTATEDACDLKVPPGSCIRFELLNIRLDSLGQPRYRLRLTNTCASPLKFVYIQVPNGLTAQAPADGAVYTAGSGNTYLVRNPNAAPFHSIRLKPLSGNLNNGESDIFEYTLPEQAQPTFILVSVKLADNTTVEAHLNTFDCPVLPYVAQANAGKSNDREAVMPASPTLLAVKLYPNPNNGLLWVDFTTAQAQPVRIQVLNTQGVLVQEGLYSTENTAISLRLPEGLAKGLYYLVVQPVESGMRVVRRFVLE